MAAAMVVRYAEPGERADLDRKYAEAMQGVAKSFPDDPDIATIAAESLMLLSPWDYWLDSGRTPKEHTTQALRLLEGALARHPDHIAAIHFYIHLVEASDRPERAEPYADRLRGAVPGAGHLLHMPALMAGQGEAALGSAEKLAHLIPDDAAQAIPSAQPIDKRPTSSMRNSVTRKRSSRS